MEGELLTVNPEPGNEFDRYALAVCKGETVVGQTCLGRFPKFAGTF